MSIASLLRERVGSHASNGLNLTSKQPRKKTQSQIDRHIAAEIKDLKAQEHPDHYPRINTGLPPKGLVWKKRITRLPPPREGSPRYWTYEMQEGQCHYCLQKTDPTDWTVDHKKPKALGGTNDRSNIIGCCRDCNGEKAMLTYIQFLGSEYIRLKRGTLKLTKKHR